ncbi:hypothetical protein RFI_39742 [Reticulomyxa filosa]|uniref:Uncharacterized protein n=1 Tax=Reticulomyxa filosa TaxID=46433 RepID=X6LAM9_RETFI|nr:hypothetical protein RFI_39742 [Reticulomyxa filosa]|eukprot:ETN97784.1 hypothetical protein RFI_39742 [Reticulomyxa filosa]
MYMKPKKLFHIFFITNDNKNIAEAKYKRKSVKRKVLPCFHTIQYEQWKKKCICYFLICYRKSNIPNSAKIRLKIDQLESLHYNCHILCNQTVYLYTFSTMSLFLGSDREEELEDMLVHVAQYLFQ